VIAQWLQEIGDGPAALLALLVAGHFMGDFLLQSRRMAEAKELRLGPMLSHGATVLVAHAVLAWPFLSWPLAAGLLVLAVVHTLLDIARSRACGAWGASLAAFFADQTLHLASVFVLWRLVAAWNGGEAAPWSPPSDWLMWYARWCVIAAAYVFNGKGGTRVVRGVLERFPGAVPSNGGEAGSEYEMGRTIGTLERYLALTLVLFGQWVALGFIIAAKSIARFPEMTGRRHKDFAEYYLIGTLVSMLVALASGVVVLRTVL
jgi:hypothetical protein